MRILLNTQGERMSLLLNLILHEFGKLFRSEFWHSSPAGLAQENFDKYML